jgi:CHASE1-domain containing sensor protein
MTTPENLKKRQERILRLLRIEGLILALVLVVVGLSQVYTGYQNDKQDECVSQQITDLTEALNARSALTQELNDATAAVLDSFVVAASKAPNPDTRTEAERRADSRPIIEALENYAQVRDEVKEAREKNPFPPFPEGTCENRG